MWNEDDEKDVLYLDTLARILLPANLIPEGSTVTKRTGDAEYILRHSVLVYTSAVKEEDKKAQVNVKGFFLFNDRGNINQIEETTLLHWHTTFDELRFLIEEIEEGIPQ